MLDAHWLGATKMKVWSLDTPKDLHEVAQQFDKELVIVISNGIHLSDQYKVQALKLKIQVPT